MLFMASQTQYRWPLTDEPAEWPVDWIGFRRCDFMCLFWSLGLLNLGWLAAAARAARRSFPFDPALGFTVPLLSVSSLVIWIVLIFGPGGTVIHQGSYATFLLLFAALAAWLTTLPSLASYVVLAIHAAVFATAWLFTCPANDFGLSNMVMIPLAAYFFVNLVRVALGRGEREANVSKSSI
jgi:hypothetical protein